MDDGSLTRTEQGHSVKLIQRLMAETRLYYCKYKRKKSKVDEFLGEGMRPLDNPESI